MFIAVEGCIGAGKSTVAKGLAAYRRSSLLAEHFEANPFLEKFYEHPERYSTETEFSFLLLHYHQLKVEKQKTAREVISDFSLEKDLIYADLNLNNREIAALFRETYCLLSKELQPIDLMLCLSISGNLLLDRIQKRNRAYEQKADPAYYLNLNSAYERFFASYPGSKLRISMDDWDFLREPALYEKLSTLIDSESSA